MCDRQECMRRVYNGCLDAGTLQLTPEEFESTCKLFHCTENGGLAFNEDLHDPLLWWVNVYCPGELPDKNLLWWLMLLCKEAGCEILATQVPSAANGRMMRRVGFQQLQDNLYGVRLC